MATAAKFEQERLEVDAVLASGIFHRAPNLALLLTYICSKYFSGESEQIKEYNIAVEALGRPPDFDQKRDSIVRVEAHRLRKRLREYYANEGASHAIHIEIPQGHYAPKFLVRDAPTAPEGEAANAVESAPEVVAIAAGQTPLEFQMVRPWYHRAVWSGIALLTAFAAVGLAYLTTFDNRKPALADSADISAMVPKTEDVRILAGANAGAYVDGFGRTWLSDRFFKDGTVFQLNNHPILGTRDPRLYESRREGSFEYDIPLKPGVYELRLHFAETLYGDTNIAGGGETSRLFNVFVNDKELLSNFDVTGEVGSNAADIKVFKDVSPAPDGKLHLRFDRGNNSAFVNAIEITPGLPGRMRPIRMYARDRGFTDKEGRYWEPDRYSEGGQIVLRTDPVSGAADPELYQGERFGNITYVIPVAPGRYGLRLHFAETWFGPDKPGRGGAGSRLFDILCNGVALLRNFDIYKEAGGSDRALTRTFRGLEANHQGKLVISLLPVRNYACINALEIVDESP